MVVLPMVEREVRVAARLPATWWRRCVVGVLAIGICALVYLDSYRYASAPQMGMKLFQGLSLLTLFLVHLAGPIFSADCLGAEKREGTLPLLFLTHLRSWDVVLGKLAGSSLGMVFTFLTLFPLLAVPLLLGGVGFGKFTLVCAGLTNTLFLSLAISILISALCSNGRASVVLSLVVLVWLSIGWPLLLEEILDVDLNDTRRGILFCLCPTYMISLVLFQGNSATWATWLNFGVTQLAAWAAIALACWFTSRRWRELPQLAMIRSWAGRLARWNRAACTRLPARQRALDRNPIVWLDRRHRSERIVPWGLVLLAVVTLGIMYLNNSRQYERFETLIACLVLQYCFYLWLAIQAPFRFTEDRQSGAFELLLCSPLSARTIIDGRLQALRTSIGIPLFASVLMAGGVLAEFCRYHPGFSRPERELLVVGIFSLILALVQGWALAALGIYFGLRHKSWLTAGVASLCWVVAFPWVAFILFMIIVDALRHLSPIFRFNDYTVFVWWFGIQLIPALIAGGFARVRLRWAFRELATQPPRTPWWLPIFRRG